MIKIELDRTQLEELKGVLDPDKLNEAIKIAIKKSTRLLKNKNKENSPVRTGNLRDRHVTSIINDGMTGEIINKAKYAIFRHEGTRKMVGLPWMVNTLNDNTGAVLDIFEKTIDKAFKIKKPRKKRAKKNNN